jgi:hypothetical protein
METIRLLAGVVGSVYLAAAASKALARARVVEFAGALGLRGRTARLLPWGLVPFEAATGAALIAGVVPLAASIAAASAATGFVVVQAYAIRKGVRTDCGCFGFERDRPGAISATRAAALALASIALVGLAAASGGSSAFGVRAVGLGCLIGIVGVVVFELAQQVAYFEQRRAELLLTHLDPEEA